MNGLDIFDPDVGEKACLLGFGLGAWGLGLGRRSQLSYKDSNKSTPEDKLLSYCCATTAGYLRCNHILDTIVHYQKKRG